MACESCACLHSRGWFIQIKIILTFTNIQAAAIIVGTPILVRRTVQGV